MSTEYFRTMPVIEVPKDSTGTILEGTVTQNGVAVDLSGATGAKLFYCKDLNEVQIVDGGTASFTTDGTNGKVEFQLTSVVVGTIRELIAHFEIRKYNTGNLITYPMILRIIQTGKV